MNNLFNQFAKSITKLYTDQMELEAIWLNRPLQTPDGPKIRITRDMVVKIENGELVDFTENPTHKILACFGTLHDQFELTLIDLKTNEPLQVKF